MWVVPFVDSGGDEYLLGPFERKPSQQEILDLLATEHPEEAAEVVALEMELRTIKLPKKPKVIPFYI